MIIRRIAPLSAAKVLAVIYAIIGVVLGAIFSVAGVMGGMASDDPGGAMFGAMFGAGAIVLFPVLYGVMGFVFTLIAAWIYNAVAGMVGGIEIDAA